MSKKSTTTITEKKTEEIQNDLRSKQEALRKIHFDITGAKAKNVKESRELRRDIARMHTELGARKRTEGQGTEVK